MGCVRSKEKDTDIPAKNHVAVKESEKNEKKENYTSTKTDRDSSREPLYQLREDCVKAHNVYRAKHYSPGLTLKAELNEMAQKWAEHLASIKTLQHSDCKLKDKIVGENIAYKWTSNGGEFTGNSIFSLGLSDFYFIRR